MFYVIWQKQNQFGIQLQNKRIRKVCTYLFYLFKEIVNSNKRQVSDEPTESTQLDFKLGISYGYTTELNLVWFLDAL